MIGLVLGNTAYPLLGGLAAGFVLSLGAARLLHGFLWIAPVRSLDLCLGSVCSACCRDNRDLGAGAAQRTN